MFYVYHGEEVYGTRQKKVSGLSVSTSKVHTVLGTVLRTVAVSSGTRTILWSVNGSCKEVSVSEVKQG